MPTPKEQIIRELLDGIVSYPVSDVELHRVLAKALDKQREADATYAEETAADLERNQQNGQMDVAIDSLRAFANGLREQWKCEPVRF